METIPRSLPILLDGATGTELYRRGMPQGVSAEAWVLEHPDALLELQRSYLDAGTQVLLTPTFGANRAAMARHGLEGQVEDYNRRLTALSRQAAQGRALVAGDMAPTGLTLAPFGKSTFEELVEIYTQQAAALEDAVAHMEENGAHAMKLRDALIDGLSKIPHSALNGDRDKRLPGNVNFCFEGIEGESLLLLLDDKGIAASSGSACTSGSLDPSHVLLAIGRPHEVAHGSLRLTLDQENTMEDVNDIIKATTDVVNYLREMSPVWKALQRGERQYVIQ